MRVSAGADAETEREGAAEEMRILQVSTMEPSGGQSITRRVHVDRLEEDQADQDNDHNPGDCVPDDESFPEPAVYRLPVVVLQHAAVQMFGHHRRLPGNLPRGGRLANRGRLCFLPKPSDHWPAHVHDHLHRQAMTGRLGFGEQPRSKQRRNRRLLPAQ